MREVIARRKEGLVTLYVICLVLVVAVLLASGVCMILQPSGSIIAAVIALLIAVVIVIPLCVINIVQISNTPEEIIVYENGFLHFPDCTCRAYEIRNVEYRFARGRRISYNWGRIIIALDGRTLDINFVADVVRVHNRLIQLMMESKGRA